MHPPFSFWKTRIMTLLIYEYMGTPGLFSESINETKLLDIHFIHHLQTNSKKNITEIVTKIYIVLA